MPLSAEKSILTRQWLDIKGRLAMPSILGTSLLCRGADGSYSEFRDDPCEVVVPKVRVIKYSKCKGKLHLLYHPTSVMSILHC